MISRRICRQGQEEAAEMGQGEEVKGQQQMEIFRILEVTQLISKRWAVMIIIIIDLDAEREREKEGEDKIRRDFDQIL